VVRVPELRLRQAPSTSATILDIIRSGGVVSVTAGRVSADGFDWVPVRTAADRAGWVVVDGLE
jgi:hypothetical protein